MARSHILFCTSEDPMEALVLDFLASCYDDGMTGVIFNISTPARHDPNFLTPPSREPVQVVPDSFAGYTVSQMRDYATALQSRRDFYHNIFAALDEQGIQDRTVVIHDYHIPPIDPDYPVDDPRQENFEPDGDLNPK
ncbi:hypothetical protein LTR95_000594 [Oleoguttula sp. CCFEE 5521]